MRRPFVSILIFLILGILFYRLFYIDIVLLSFILFSLYVIFRMFFTSSRSKYILVFLLGSLLLFTFDFSIPNLENQELKDVRATVVNKTERDDFIEYIFRVRDKSKFLDRSFKLSYQENIQKEFQHLSLGEKVNLSCRLDLPGVNRNPKMINRRDNYYSKGIYFRIVDPDYIQTNIYIKNPLLKIKGGFSPFIGDVFKDLSEENRTLIKAIILGDANQLESSRKETYQELGLAHLLAVSGLHIGILASFLLFLLSYVLPDKRLSYLIILLSIFIYGYILDFPPSIVRAGLMLFFLYLSKSFYRAYDSLNIISLVMILSLLKNPYSLFTLGFQLSFLASFSIALLNKFFKSLFYSFPDIVGESLSPILSVQLGLFPFQIYYFNYINPVSILANLLLVPLVSLGLVVGFMAILIYPFSKAIHGFIIYLLDSILNINSFILDMIDRTFFEKINLASFDIYFIVFLYLILFLFIYFYENRFIYKRYDKNILRLWTGYLSFLIVLNLMSIATSKRIEIHFVDVGQGDCALVRTRGRNYLIDSGGSIFEKNDIGRYTTLPYLQKLGVRKLDGVFISHFHEDHFKGLYSILDDIEIDKIMISYLPEDRSIIEKFKDYRIPIYFLKEGDILDLSRSLKLYTLYPQTKEDFTSDNNTSLVFCLSSGYRKILFTGDMEEVVEKSLLENERFKALFSQGKELDFIKVPHHGSSTSSSMEFLEFIRPKNAFISLGVNNMYNHPSQEVIERYDELGTSIYRTDESGRILLTLDGESYEVSEYLFEGELRKIHLFEVIYDNIFIISLNLLTFMLLYILIRILPRGVDFFVL